MTELIVTVNAPGEVAGWLLPLAEQVKRRDPSVVIEAVLTPCPFAGGRERHILSSHPALDHVTELFPFVRTLIAERRRRRSALVLHLGGDRIYSLLIGRLLRAPVWVYGTSRRWSRWYERCLVPDARTARKLMGAGVPAERLATVGEMVVDSVPEHVDPSAALRRLGLDEPGLEVVSLLAGSRPYEIDFMVPFYADLIDYLARHRPSVRCLLPFSEFVEPSLLEQALAAAGIQSERNGSAVTAHTRGGATAHIVREDRYAAMAASKIAVTLPGTNTLQLAALGTAMVVVVPLNRVEDAVVEGPINWLSPKWTVTRALKRRLLLRLNERLGPIALPNILAGRRVVPELRAMLQPSDVGDELIKWLSDDAGRRAMRDYLVQLAGVRGAAARMAGEILQAGGTCAAGC